MTHVETPHAHKKLLTPKYLSCIKVMKIHILNKYVCMLKEKVKCP